MSKTCPISGCKTNCTDNCASCQAEEKRYAVKAYFYTNFSYLMANLETDDIHEAQDFIHENCLKGFNCKLIDTQCDTVGWIYAAEFLQDLHMEQLEQM